MTADSFNPRPLPVSIIGLGVTQIVGWGSTFFTPSVMGRHIGEDLRLPAEIVFAGPTIMFVVAALLAPRIGRTVDRRGARSLMATGSVLGAIGLAALSQAQGAITYIAAWLLLGIAGVVMMGTISSIALAQIAGDGARRALALLTTVGGLASTVFWPLGGALDATLGWRSTVLLYAGLHLLVCLPIHLLVLPSSAPPRLPPTPPRSPGAPPPTPVRRPMVFALLAIGLSTGGIVYTGMTLYLIEILRELGHSPATAVVLASFMGPIQIIVRLMEIALASRLSSMNSAIIGAAALPVALLVGLAGSSTVAAGFAIVALYAIANGLKAVVRATLPLALFERSEYGRYMGWLAVPLNVVTAIAPVVFAALMERGGVTVTLLASLVAAALSLGTILALSRLARRPAA
ncbi:MAG: MFS transporter [Alphaproteobacteria bacterium]|nr:MFS transporter [Alphaproteobacteria bacterium]MCW5743042.1 MFS transporter [Alphaproteobacteria bacterium]